jgi:hypothetical protein
MRALSELGVAMKARGTARTRVAVGGGAHVKVDFTSLAHSGLIILFFGTWKD